MGDLEMDNQLADELNREFMESSQSHFFDAEDVKGLAQDTEDFDARLKMLEHSKNRQLGKLELKTQSPNLPKETKSPHDPQNQRTQAEPREKEAQFQLANKIDQDSSNEMDFSKRKEAGVSFNSSLKKPGVSEGKKRALTFEEEFNLEEMQNPMFEKKPKKADPPLKEGFEDFQKYSQLDFRSKEKKLKDLVRKTKELESFWKNEKVMAASAQVQLKKLESDAQKQENLQKPEKSSKGSGGFQNSSQKPGANKGGKRSSQGDNGKLNLENKIGQMEIRLDEEYDKLHELKKQLKNLKETLMREVGPFGSFGEIPPMSSSQSQQLSSLQAKMRSLSIAFGAPEPKSQGSGGTGVTGKKKKKKETAFQLLEEEKRALEAQNSEISKEVQVFFEKMKKVEKEKKSFEREVEELTAQWKQKKKEFIEKSQKNKEEIEILRKKIVKNEIALDKLARMEVVTVERVIEEDEEELEEKQGKRKEIMQMKEKLERMRSIAKDKDAQINNLISASQREENASYGLRNTPSSKNQFFMTSSEIMIDVKKKTPELIHMEERDQESENELGEVHDQLDLAKRQRDEEMEGVLSKINDPVINLKYFQCFLTSKQDSAGELKHLIKKNAALKYYTDKYS